MSYGSFCKLDSADWVCILHLKTSALTVIVHGMMLMHIHFTQYATPSQATISIPPLAIFLKKTLTLMLITNVLAAICTFNILGKILYSLCCNCCHFWY